MTRIIDALDDGPPRRLQEARPLFIRPSQLNTVRLMHDPHVFDEARWFDTTPGARPVQANNEVTYLIRGQETYQHMAEAIRSTTRPNARVDPNSPPFIYLAGWGMGDIHFKLVPGDPSSSIEQLFTSASSAGVEIRVMLWANVKGPGQPFTTSQVRFFNSLPTGRAILDNKTGVFVVVDRTVFLRRGAHHQKVLIVNGDQGLQAFCGGVDITEDRMDANAGGFGLGLHDVHCKVRGAAARELLTVFSQRWDDYVNGPDDVDFTIPSTLPELHHDPERPAVGRADLLLRNQLAADRPSFKPAPFPPGNAFVQVGRTFHRRLHHRFAYKGEQTVKRAILKAIAEARQFIYIEDQYLVNMEASNALKAAIAKNSFKHLIILIPDDGGLEGEFFGQAPFRRARFIKNLTGAPGGHKVHVLARDRYIHSKIYIVDDRLAVIGSANCNRRGWEHDSEAICVITDRSSAERPALHFARRLRMRLWADHLNLRQNLGLGNVPFNPNLPDGEDADFAELADGVASAIHWISIPPNSHIHPYVVNDDFNHALAGLRKQIPGTDADGTPPGVVPSVRRAVVNLLIRPSTVDLLWDELIDPASPLDP